MKRFFAVAFLSLLALTGCAEQNGEVSTTERNSYELSEYVYQYKGSDLHCVGRGLGLNSAVLSCDFVRYHAENG